jgi:hypothetical protein
VIPSRDDSCRRHSVPPQRPGWVFAERVWR